MGGTYPRPKDSSGVRNRATWKALEGADRVTDTQTDRLPTYYSKIALATVVITLCHHTHFMTPQKTDVDCMHPGNMLE